MSSFGNYPPHHPPHIKAPIKIIGVLVVVGLLFLVARLAMSHGWIPTPGIAKSLVPERVVLPSITESKLANVKPLPLPGNNDCGAPVPLALIEEWKWNAQMAFNYANGGKTTKTGSLMCKHDVNLEIKNQDDTNQMMHDLATCASALAGGADHCDESQGAVGILVMGDQTAGLFGSLNPQLSKTCSDCIAETVGIVGRSDGEDALWGPASWKSNPHSMLGDGLIAAACREGDWNIALKYEGDNDLKNNPDETTFDRQAVNWLCIPDYLKAAEAWFQTDDPNHGVCVDRKEVVDGHLTGKTVQACVRGFASWTPADVNSATNKGGLVRIVSSHEYSGQMPDTLILIKKFADANRKEVDGMLAATFEAADQVRAFPTALEKAGAVSADIYGDKDANYWVKYYKGVVERDKTGVPVPLGGSKVANLADNIAWFGLKGGNAYYKSTYEKFGKIVSQQYPTIVPKVPSYSQIADSSFVRDVMQSSSGGGAAPEAPKFTYGQEASNVVSKRSWHINFQTNSDVLTSDGEQQVEQMKDDIAIARDLQVKIDGYTDATGNPVLNQDLSRRRAEAVKRRLEEIGNFPDQRFRVAGHGPANPVASNATPEGRAQNRRVDITLAE